ncbi:MAG: UDP-N-acetylmuramoyl-L-alanyl-D-glutamate--2,6-diaminopimelate ligase [Cyanobacteria bacterium]|nr:UDP-N-acetylmuramoyl-L-alanyl-D-glutamate--2,6-diaminopimelate ligase [Cyanobacteriota bacterium]
MSHDLNHPTSTRRTLETLLASLKPYVGFDWVRPAHFETPIDITSITSDSRAVSPGGVFVALSGVNTDGHQYLQQAVQSGASLLVCDKTVLAQRTSLLNDLNLKNSAVIEVDNTYMALAALSAVFYGEPAKQLTMVGVTGTNGKTTVTHLVEQMLLDWHKNAAVIGTLGIKTAASQQYETTGHTTPMAPELQKTLSDLVSRKTDYVVMEVSSHALDQDRTYGCTFQVAVVTNVTQDHLDYHKTMARYCEAKTRLFSALAPGASAVINMDDEWAQEFVKATPNEVCQWTYSIDDPKASVRATHVEFGIDGSQFHVQTPVGQADVNLKIAGRFSIYNALAALCAGLALGIPLENVVSSLEKVKGVRGRFEVVASKPYVIVDYAHTPDGLENVLSAAKRVTPEGARLIAVFGCGGDRDATKRPKMGAIVERIADLLVVTSDNPRSEDPQQIITDILSGIQRFDSSRMIVNADREEAIHRAIDLAGPEDIIVIAGKGHEDYQILADRVIHFDDREVVQAYVAVAR